MPPGAADPRSEADDSRRAVDPKTEVIGAGVRNPEHYARVTGVYVLDFQIPRVLVYADRSPIFGELFRWIESGTFGCLPKLVCIRVFLFPEQREETVDRTLFAPIAEV